MENGAGGAPPATGDSIMSGTEPETDATKPESSQHYSYISDTKPNEPPTTFTSSLSIVVDGTTPIEKADTSMAASTSAFSTSENFGKRMPRNFKSDALAALNRSRSPSSDIPQSSGSVAEKEKEKNSISTLNGAPATITSSLDMSSVKTTAPRKIPPRKQPRPFELEDCPIYYPSPEEFQDALAYIRSIEPEAREYGIAKIVPPMGWKMPFVTDTETYRFKTRAMKLNSIEASSRVKINFLEALYRFHRQEGNPRIAVPTINHKPVDLWLLRKEVQKLGGFEAVNQEKKWADVGRLLGYRGIPGLSTQLRNSYIRVILPYEHYSESFKNAASVSSAKKDIPVPVTTEADSRGHVSPLSSPSVSSSPLSELPDDEDGTKKLYNGDSANGKATNGHLRSASPEVSMSKGTCCEICHKRNRETEMLLCDGCDCGFHMFCLTPALTTVPKGQWYCHSCLFGTGGDYGFDDGEEHSLSSFQARDQQFRKMWFLSHPPPQPEGPLSQEEMDDPTVSLIGNIRVSETDVEKEFWRLVQSPYETVEIEYGADVHSTTHGSGMPTVETHPLDPYSRDPWNLNNMPILKDSLLRYIKSEISGMTVPWTYVGMVFSTFCWHNEDHYTHSVNYMHWGDTKTWYGIPGADAETFEAAIKKEAPDLFETQPDLLFQLVTLMSPQTLKQEGVRMYACDQRAGEFVITFPKAYHCGFNHGLNFNEAVNFALPDWLPLGQECVQRYQEHKKQPVFSYEELLITISQQSRSISTATWLNDCFSAMVDRELLGRDKVRNDGAIEFTDDRDVPEEQYQCSHCKAFCYLSQVKCSCGKRGNRVVCLDHSENLCSCPLNRRILRLRFPDEELAESQATIASKASAPRIWREKLSKLLNDSPAPPLRNLRALVAEADRIHYPLKEAPMLRRCVRRAQEWIDQANTFTTRKQSRIRSGKRGRRTLAGEEPMDETTEKSEKTLEDIYALLKDVDNLGFDSPEIGQLRHIAQQAEDFKAKAGYILKQIEDSGNEAAHLKECKALVAHGASLNVQLDELFTIENIVLQHQLTNELEQVDDSRITLDQIQSFLARAKACYLPADNIYMKLLEEKLRVGTDWDQRASDLINKPSKTIEEMSEFLVVESAIPVNPGVLNTIHALRAKAHDFEKQAKEWLAPEVSSTKPTVQEALRLIQRSEKEFKIPAVSDLKKTVDIAYDLEERCNAVLKGTYMHREGDSAIDAMKRWNVYAAEHLGKFRLPGLLALDVELQKHDLWLKKLPWFSQEDEQPHARDVLMDVLKYTKPGDDRPPLTDKEYLTCICFEPVLPPPPGEASDAVQCEHCNARFHGKCADKRFSCPFCDPHQWNGDINSSRSYHFCYLPTVLRSASDITRNFSEHWNDLKTICTHVERLSSVIGHFLSEASLPENQTFDNIPQVRHFLRKLYKLGFAVSPNPEVSFGLDLAGLHRILAIKPTSSKPRKRRKPKFKFGQDVDDDWKDGTRCVCRGKTAYLSGLPTVQCIHCSKAYHEVCVCYKGGSEFRSSFICPVCCMKSGKPFQWADVRVHHIDDADPNVYVDLKACLDTYSKHPVRIKLSNPPATATILLDLVHFVPGHAESHVKGETSSSHRNVDPQTSKMRIKQAPDTPESYPPWSHSDGQTSSGSRVGSHHSDPYRNSSVGASEGVLSFKKKRKYIEEGGDNVHVFEVDPQVSTGAGQNIHVVQSVMPANPTHASSHRQQYTPPSGVVLSHPQQSPPPGKYYAEAGPVPHSAMYPSSSRGHDSHTAVGTPFHARTPSSGSAYGPPHISTSTRDQPRSHGSPHQGYPARASPQQPPSVPTNYSPR